jgi:hypothetical protein
MLMRGLVLILALVVPEQFFEMIGVFFLVASCCGIPFISDSSMAEARALRHGLLGRSQF